MKRTILVFLVLLLGLGREVYAQGARNGTNAADELNIPVDAEFLGGGSAAANATGLAGVLWNPAGLDRATGDVSVMLARRSYFSDTGINFAAVGMRFGRLGSLALSLRSFDLGSIERTDEFNMDGTGETFSPTFFTLGATYSRQMTDRISIGGTANLVYESFSNVGASGVAVDAGVQYQEFLGVQGLRIGVAIRNIGTSMRYDGSSLLQQGQLSEDDRGPTQYKVVAAAADMPTVVDIAASYNVFRGLSLGATYMENTYGPSQVRALAQYDFYGWITARAAYNFAVDDPNQLAIDQPAFGATLNLQQAIGANLALDYGYMPAQFFGATHVFAIRGQF
ncbi:MAG TPA: PorV/PorQ family protein [Rhodothermales bacterium]|nr:PorV/PorQ family protein [Rhodothermales bacterium]